MSITATATPVPAIGAVRLTVSATADVVELYRTDNNGTRTVRTLAGLLPSAAFVTEDYEAATAGPVSYTVRTAAEAVTVPATAPGGTWLTVPIAPAHAVELVDVEGYADVRESLATVHDVIARPDPLVTLAPLRTRAGDLTLWFADYPAAAGACRILAKPAVLLLRQPQLAGLDLWFVVRRIATAPRPDVTIPRRWSVVVEYRETQPQTGPLTGTLGRDWGDVLVELPTWLETMNTYSTWAEVMSA